MNNSELSTVAPSEEIFAEASTSVFPSDWSTSPSEFRQNGSSNHNGSNHKGNNSGGVTIAEQIREESTLEIRVVEKVRAGLEARRPDLGLWLFERSGDRLGHWERLRDTLQGAYEPHELSARYASGLFKRSFDVLGSLLLLVVLSPLLFLTAILIKLDSPGPVFFRHDRVGRHGRHFLLWKYRSMKTSVPKYEMSPRSSADVRLTRVGRLIRRLSIDELPQLFNVLQGQMSLVGPRPEMPFIVARYRPLERQRLAAKPGITGLWQISAARSFPIHEHLHYDLHYIRNQNAILDCAILLRTITAVLGGVGAV
jgi:lipopolysaccharide/colanic/teichoic acid biosynthesis glycosyltransferase